MTDALDFNVRTALEIVEQRLEEKRAKRLDAQGEAQRALNKAQEFDRVIAKLEADQASLKRIIGTSIATVPAVSETVDYRRAHFFTARGHRDNYIVNSVLVLENGRKVSVVLECECPAFRFTKGELRNGKTCKHITNYVARYGRSHTALRAKTALRKAGELTGSSPLLHNNY